MNDGRLPRVCLSRLNYLLDKQSSKYETNWLSRLKGILDGIGMGHLCYSTDPSLWLTNKSRILSLFSIEMKNDDLQRNGHSKSLQMKIPRAISDTTARYLFHCPVGLTRIVAQIRLANNFSGRMICNNKIFRLNPNEYCKLCKYELESVEHLLIRCVSLENLRAVYFKNVRKDIPQEEMLLTLLRISNPVHLKSLALFMSDALMHREKILNEK